jgi:hypothetical protein
MLWFGIPKGVKPKVGQDIAGGERWKKKLYNVGKLD